MHTKRLKTDREKYEKAKQKQRERYHKTKRLVKNLTPKERYNANVIWKLRKRQLKARKKAAEGLLQQTPPDSPTFDLNVQGRTPPPSPSSRDRSSRITPPPCFRPLPGLRNTVRCSPRLTPRSGKEIPRNAPLTNTTPTTTPVASPQATPPLTPRIRSCDSSPSGTPKNRRRNKVKRDRARVHRENQILKQNIKKLKQKYDKYKKRFEREKKKMALDTEKNEDLRNAKSYGKLEYRDLTCFCESESLRPRGFCSCLNPKLYDLAVLFDANKNELLPDLTNEDALPEALEAHMINFMASDTLT
ncbi:unnamed protein product [Diatraea saccharalis]|uniref:Uncharacterized protein n=1 Tax=Diatraea saccharalis TaxID=40085 RepID=A0A9N9RCT8_9NEOP|nr:unnamed protein product [Diatraea saccharalis]